MTELSELLWNHAIEMEDYLEADRVATQRSKLGADMGSRGVSLCSSDEKDTLVDDHILAESNSVDIPRVDSPSL